MRHYIISIPFLLIAMIGFSQSKEAREKIEAAKIALITERLELSPQQAEKFWPIYNEFNREQKKIRDQFLDAKKDFDPRSATEEQNKELLQFGMKLKERQLDLEKQYTNRILNVINSRQLMSLRKAEEDFKRMLMERVRQRERAKERLRNNQNLQEQRNQRKNNEG